MMDHDWAEKIAVKLEVGIEGLGPEQFIEKMATALRRAKADGMREAAGIAAAEKLSGVPPVDWTLEQISLVEGAVVATTRSITQNIHIAANLIEAADKIERGNT